jgi:predicted RNA binding protein YcfA (HicA-like mRNA interferase family)
MKRATWQELKKLCELCGWVEDRMKGDHLIMVKPGAARPVVIKMDKELGERLIQSVKRSAALTTDGFHALLEQVRTGRVAKPKAEPPVSPSDLPN